MVYSAKMQLSSQKGEAYEAEEKCSSKAEANLAIQNKNSMSYANYPSIAYFSH